MDSGHQPEAPRSIDGNPLLVEMRIDFVARAEVVRAAIKWPTPAGAFARENLQSRIVALNDRSRTKGGLADIFASSALA